MSRAYAIKLHRKARRRSTGWRKRNQLLSFQSPVAIPTTGQHDVCYSTFGSTTIRNSGFGQSRASSSLPPSVLHSVHGLRSPKIPFASRAKQFVMNSAY